MDHRSGGAEDAIKTEYLQDANLSKSDLESKVESVIQTAPPDGILEASDGSIYLTDIEENAIVRFDPTATEIKKVIEDKRLSWPDTMSWGPGGALYVTCSQIQNMPRFNNGKDVHIDPYKVFKVTGISER